MDTPEARLAVFESGGAQKDSVLLWEQLLWERLEYIRHYRQQKANGTKTGTRPLVVVTSIFRH